MKGIIVALALLVSSLVGQADEYAKITRDRWEQAEVLPSKQAELRWVEKNIERSKYRYEEVSKDTGVAWWAIACLHNMECGLNFTQHLHNGDPLTRRTVQVPAGRPTAGKPPFTWEFSAKDALVYDHMDKVDWSKLIDSLRAFEGYNGWGYYYHHKNTPTNYLYSGTTVQKAGKYTSDGRWDSRAWSGQIGVVAILKQMNIELHD